MAKKNCETESTNISRKPRKTRSPKTQENVITQQTDIIGGEPSVINNIESSSVPLQVEIAEVTAGTFDATAGSIALQDDFNLNVLKSVDKHIVNAGDTVTFTSVITNTGSFPASNVEFTDTLPNGLAFVPGSVTINDAPSGDNPNIGVALQDIPVGGSVTVTFKAKVVCVPTPNPSVNIAVVDASFIVRPGEIPFEESFSSNPVALTIKPCPFIGFKQFTLQEKVCLPAAKPDIEEINKVTAAIVITSTKVIKTPKAISAEGQILTGLKLIIEGELRQIVEYTADEPTQSVHAAHFNMPFSTFIVLPEDYVQGTPVVVTGHIEDIYAKQIDKRCIFKNITILVTAK